MSEHVILKHISNHAVGDVIISTGRCTLMVTYRQYHQEFRFVLKHKECLSLVYESKMLQGTKCWRLLGVFSEIIVLFLLLTSFCHNLTTPSQDSSTQSLTTYISKVGLSIIPRALRLSYISL